MQYTHVLSPLQIGSLELKNRFVVPAMATNFADFDGTVSDRLINYWRPGPAVAGACSSRNSPTSIRGARPCSSSRPYTTTNSSLRRKS